MNQLNRRPLQSRSWPFIRSMAKWLSSSPVTPNMISLASVIFAIVAAAGLLWGVRPLGLLICALGIQLRLLCNLLDGLVAVEGGRKSVLGDLYNELPDRVSDTILIVALGYASQLGWLGWLGALAAVLTAYVRLLGGSLGLPQNFRGPQSKSQRMAVMTGGCLLACVEYLAKGDWRILQATLLVIVVGSFLTCIVRILSISALLRLRQEK